MSGLSWRKFEWGGGGRRGEQGPERLGEERREEQDQAQRMEAEGPETMVLYYPRARRKWETCFQERPAWVAGDTDNSVSMPQCL